jgi:hypothetical protein
VSVNGAYPLFSFLFLFQLGAENQDVSEFSCRYGPTEFTISRSDDGTTFAPVTLDGDGIDAERRKRDKHYFNTDSENGTGTFVAIF